MSANKNIFLTTAYT